MVYSKYVEENANFNIYSYKLQKIPTPKFICFYNGVDKTADRKILRLSEAYNGEGDVEVKVLMLNINYGHNKELLNICKPLSDYAWFVERIRYNQKITDNIEMAVDQAIEEMDEASQVKEFILANKAEVRRMCITEYDETKVLAALKEESREEGRAEGILDTLIDLVKKGLLSVSNAATQAGMSVSEFELKSGLKA